MLGCLQDANQRDKNASPDYAARVVRISGIFAIYFTLGAHKGDFMKSVILTIAALSIALFFASADAEEHALGMPNIVFCTAFAKKVSAKMPMPYKDFIKLTDGDGMPIRAERRHWDGKNNSYLSIDLHTNFVKGGLITCPNGESIPFGAWDVPD